MKKVYVNEERCLGCHLCEFYCGFAHSGKESMEKAYNCDNPPVARIQIEEGDAVNFAVSCRHCETPLCVKSCITGALSKNADGVVTVDENRCIGCFTCILSCPYGSIVPDGGKPVKKCDLCVQSGGEPACAAACPNRAIVFEERGEMK